MLEDSVIEEISYQVHLLRPLLPPVSARLVKSPHRTHAGREVDFVPHAPDRVLAIEAKAGQQAHRIDARPLAEAVASLAPRGVRRDAWRLGLIVTRGCEVQGAGARGVGAAGLEAVRAGAVNGG
jgi:hypothetical protein